jgi:hypothetical protein
VCGCTVTEVSGDVTEPAAAVIFTTPGSAVNVDRATPVSSVCTDVALSVPPMLLNVTVTPGTVAEYASWTRAVIVAVPPF